MRMNDDIQFRSTSFWRVQVTTSCCVIIYPAPSKRPCVRTQQKFRIRELLDWAISWRPKLPPAIHAIGSEW